MPKKTKKYLLSGQGSVLKTLLKKKCPSILYLPEFEGNKCNSFIRGRCRECWETALKPYEVKESE